MEQSDLLRKLASELDHLGIRYLVTGSVATINYGEPRFTNDIDVVAELRVEQVDAFCAAFPAPEFYLAEDAVVQAIQNRFQFNILHPQSGLKIDIIISADTEFDRSRFSRGLRTPVGADFDAWFASPEDVIVKKLEYYKQGQSEKHVRDILGVLKVRGEKLDRDYVAIWAERLEVSDIWHAILERAEK